MRESNQNDSKNEVQLKISSILNVPLHKYEKDFTFIVNGKNYETNRFVADLISKKICDLHSLDPTVSTYTIQTKTKGDFSKIINLISFEKEEFSLTDVLFLKELNKIIDFGAIEINFGEKEERSISNIFEKIKQHEADEIYIKNLTDDIEFLATHLYLLDEQEMEKIKELKLNTIEMILHNSHIQIESEDQLLRLINKLYKIDSKYSVLYDYVYFINCSDDCMCEFVNLFDQNDMTTETWRQISHRLSNQKATIDETRYKKNQTKFKRIEIPFEKNNNFNGIFNYLKKENINDLIKITSSQISTGKIENIINYEDQDSYIYTSDLPNSWVCIEFVKNLFIPTCYTLRTRRFAIRHLRNWIIECSNDGNIWDTVDEQNNCNCLKKEETFHTFMIENINNKEINKPYKFLRLKQTGKNSCGENDLVLNAIEIFGTLVEE